MLTNIEISEYQEDFSEDEVYNQIQTPGLKKMHKEWLFKQVSKIKQK